MLIVSLNIVDSKREKLSEFLSTGERVRLKSPRRSQGVGAVGAAEETSSRKAGFSEC